MKLRELTMKRKFTGVWIPAEVYLDEDLNWTEKILFLEITNLDIDKGCFASNKYFQDLLGVSDSIVSKYLTKLINCGYIYEDSASTKFSRILHSYFEVTTNKGKTSGLTLKEDVTESDEITQENLNQSWPEPQPKLVTNSTKVDQNLNQSWPENQLHKSSYNISNNKANNKVNNKATTNPTNSTTNIRDISRKMQVNSNISENNANLQGEPNRGTVRSNTPVKPPASAILQTTFSKKAEKYIRKKLKGRPISQEDHDRMLNCLLGLCEHFDEVKGPYSTMSTKMVEENVDAMLKMCLTVDDMEEQAKELIRRGFYSVKRVQVEQAPPKQTAISAKSDIQFEEGEVY